MDQMELEESSVVVCVTKKSFEQSIYEPSEIAQMLEAELNHLREVEVILREKEQIEDLDFVRVTTKFDTLKLKLRRLTIRCEPGNYISPQKFVSMIIPMRDTLEILQLYVGDTLKINAIEWIRSLSTIIGLHKFKKIHFILTGLLEICLDNQILKVKVEDNIDFNAECLQILSKLCHGVIELNIDIGANNNIANGLQYWSQFYTILNLTIGQACSVNTQSIITLLNQSLIELKINIQGQNLLDSSLIESILRLVGFGKLLVLQLIIGNQNKLFQQQFELSARTQNQLQILDINIGQANNLKSQAHKVFNNLLNSSQLHSLKFRIGDFNITTPQECSKIFDSLAHVQGLQSLELIIDQNIFLTQSELDKICQVISQNSSLINFKFQISRQRFIGKEAYKSILDMSLFFKQLTCFKQIETLNLKFSSKIDLSQVDLLGQKLTELRSLQRITLTFDGTNEIDYFKLTSMLRQLKSMESLQELIIQNGQQLDGKHHQDEIFRNVQVLDESLIMGLNKIIKYYYTINLAFIYDFEQLKYYGPVYPQFQSNIKHWPIPINVINIIIDEQYRNPQLIALLLSKVKDQQTIVVKVGKFVLSNTILECNAEEFALYVSHCDKLVGFMKFDGNLHEQLVPIQQMVIRNQWKTNLFLKNQDESSLIYYDLELNTIAVKFADVRLNALEFQNLFYILELIKEQHVVKEFKCIIGIQNSRVDWSLFGNFLSDIDTLESLNIMIGNANQTETTIQSFAEFSINWLKIIATNKALVKVEIELPILFDPKLPQHLDAQLNGEQEPDQDPDDIEVEAEQQQNQILDQQVIDKQKKLLNLALDNFELVQKMQLKKKKLLSQCILLRRAYQKKYYNPLVLVQIAELLI